MVEEMSLLTLLSPSENPTKLTAQERQSHGITKKLPTSISKALEAAAADEDFREALGKEMYTHYLAMKKDEQGMLNELSEKDRRIWLMERY